MSVKHLRGTGDTRSRSHANKHIQVILPEKFQRVKKALSIMCVCEGQNKGCSVLYEMRQFIKITKLSTVLKFQYLKLAGTMQMKHMPMLQKKKMYLFVSHVSYMIHPIKLTWCTITCFC